MRCDERMHMFADAKNESGYAEKIFDVFKKQFSDYVYTFAVFEDRDWEMYFKALYPGKYEYQSIMNLKLTESIRQEGDCMSPRVIEHCLFFKKQTQREVFLSKITEKGFFEITAEKMEDKTDFAEEFGGYYDGWGCGVVW